MNEHISSAVSSHPARLLTLFAIFLVSGMLLASVLYDAPPEQKAAAIVFMPRTPAPELNAQAYFVKIIGSDDLLLQRRAGKRLPPASLTKIATALVAYDRLLPNTNIELSGDAKNTPDPDAKLSVIPAGEVFARDAMLQLALIGSYNDAARALAEAIGAREGGETFNERMALFQQALGQKVHELGLANSQFLNPTGLDEDGHYASAEDLATIAEYIWLHAPKLWELSRAGNAVVISQQGNRYDVKNTDDLLREFPALLGTKTGFTDNAKGALILLYPVRPDHAAVIVLLGSEDRFGDGKKILQWLDAF